MRHSFYLAFALALMVGTTEVRAELVTYYMSGTVIPLSTDYNAQSFVPAGTHISWTLQYNNSTPLHDYSPGVKSVNIWNPTNPLITNIHYTGGTGGFYIPSTTLSPDLVNSEWNSGLTLSSGPPNGSSSFYVWDSSFGSPPYPEGFYGSDLLLNIKGPLSTFNLANLPLNQLPVDLSTSYFTYRMEYDMTSADVIQFSASVDSISNPVYGAPEPGSLTLFLLGAAGLAACGMRRRLRQVG